MVPLWYTNHLDKRCMLSHYFMDTTCKSSTLGLVSTWMGDYLQMGKPSQYVTIHPGLLSLAIPLGVGAVSISESRGLDTRQAHCMVHPFSHIVSCCLAEG